MTLQQKSRKSSRRTKAALLVVAIVAGSLWIGWRTQVFEGTGPPAEGMSNPAIAALARDETGSQHPPPASEVPKSSLPIAAAPATTVKSPVAPAAAPPSADVSKRPVDIILTAPIEGRRGDIIEIGLALAPYDTVHSAVFRVLYDPATLEPTELGDATSMSATGELEVRIDQQQALVQPHVVRFLADAPMPRTADLLVTAQAWDALGNEVKVGAPASHTIVLWP